MARTYKVSDKEFFKKNDIDEAHPQRIQTHFTLEMKRQLNRRIDLICQSIVGGLLSGNDPEKVSFRHILNRVMLLIQQPLFFIIYFENQDSTFSEHYRSVKNHKDKGKIDKFTKLVTDKDGSVKDRKKEKSKLIKLFGSSYYLLPIFVGKKTNKEYEFRSIENIYNRKWDGKIDPSISPKTIEHILSYLLSNVFHYENYESYGSEFRRLLKLSIEKCRNKTPEESKNDELAPPDITPHIPNPDVRKEVFKKFNELMLSNNNLFLVLPKNGYLDAVFKKNKSNLKHLSKFVRNNTNKDGKIEDEDVAANYIVFIRDYAVDAGYKRNFNQTDIDDYGKNYRIRMALCDEQKEDMRNHFKRLRKKYDSHEEIIDYVSSLKDEYKAVGSPVRKMAESLDKWFWTEFKKGNLKEDASESEIKEFENSIDEFINIMGSYFSTHARASADPVFDGLIYFRQQFSDGGIERCFPNTNPIDGKPDIIYSSLDDVLKMEQDEKEKNSNDGCVENAKDSKEIIPSLSNDLKRLVIGYYWYQGMLPSTEKLSEWVLMLTPIEISGSVMAVTGYFSPACRFSANLDGEEYDVKSHDVAWNQCYHLYQDVNARFKKELRHSMAKCYKDLIAYFYVQSLSEENKGEVFLNAKTPLEMGRSWAKWVSLRFAAICELMPYDTVVVSDLCKGKATPFGAFNLTDLKVRKNSAYVNPKFHCVPELVHNKHYPTVLDQPELGRFMKIEDIQIALTDAALHPLSMREAAIKKK